MGTKYKCQEPGKGKLKRGIRVCEIDEDAQEISKSNKEYCIDKYGNNSKSGTESGTTKERFNSCNSDDKCAVIGMQSCDNPTTWSCIDNKPAGTYLGMGFKSCKPEGFVNTPKQSLIYNHIN